MSENSHANVKSYEKGALRSRIVKLLILSTLLSAFSAVNAAQYAVSNLKDRGLGSLREALLQAKNGDHIVFTPTLFGVISLESPLPWINGDLVLQGPALGSVSIDGMDQFQIFFVNKGKISISNLKLSRGYNKGGDGGNSASGCGGGALGAGAGLFVNTNAQVVLRDVSIMDCTAVGGNGGELRSLYSTGTGGGGGGGYSDGRGGDGGGNFGVGGGGGGGGGFSSRGGHGMDGGGGGGGITAVVSLRTYRGHAQDAAGQHGGNGGAGFKGGGIANGDDNGHPGENANPEYGGGGGGGGGVSFMTMNGGNGGLAGAIGGGGGAGGGARGGIGGSGSDFGGGGGGGGSVVSKIVARGGFGGFAGGGGGGAGGALNNPGGHGAAGGYGAGGGGGGQNNMGGQGGAGLGGNGGDNCGSGGGGAALGAAIFVRTGGSLQIQGGNFFGNKVVAGRGGGNPHPGEDGKGKGKDIYVMAGSSVVFGTLPQGSNFPALDIAGEGIVVADGWDPSTQMDNSLTYLSTEQWQAYPQN